MKCRVTGCGFDSRPLRSLRRLSCRGNLYLRIKTLSRCVKASRPPGDHQEISTRSPVSRWAKMGIIRVRLAGMLCAGKEHRTPNKQPQPAERAREEGKGGSYRKTIERRRGRRPRGGGYLECVDLSPLWISIRTCLPKTLPPQPALKQKAITSRRSPKSGVNKWTANAQVEW